MKNLLFSILFLFALGLFAQSSQPTGVSMNKGLSYPVYDAKSKLYFNVDNGNVISVKTRGKEVCLQLFSTATMKETSRKEYIDFPVDFNIQTVAQIADRLYYIYCVFNKEKMVTDVYAREINTTNATFNEGKLLFTASGELADSPISFNDVSPSGTSLYGFNPTFPKVMVYKSSDNSKLLFQYCVITDTKNKVSLFNTEGFSVFDKDMNSISSNEVKMPYSLKDMDNIAFGVTNSGTGFMITYQNKLKKYILMKISATGTIESFDFDIPLIYFNNLVILEDSKGNLTCSGFYTNSTGSKYEMGTKAFSGKVKGIGFFVLSPQGVISGLNTTEFTSEFINKYSDVKETEKTGLHDLYLTDYKVLEDGCVLYFGEQKWVYSFVKASDGHTKYVFMFSNAVLVKLDNKGNLIWNQKAPKIQVGPVGLGTLSAKLISGENYSYILFVDNPKNANPKKQDISLYQDELDADLVMFKINNLTGDSEKQVLFNVKKFKNEPIDKLYVKNLVQTDKDAFMFEVYMGLKKDSMIKIEMK